MGILTNSKQLREKVLQMNLYKAESAYNLNKDIVTRTLNKAQALGFDLRGSLLLNTLERVVDNTPLVRDGAERLAVEMGRRMADNAVHRNLPAINIDNIFSNRADKKVFTKNEDMSITPKGAGEKGVLDFIKGNLGFRRLKSAEESFIQETGDVEDQPGGVNFYNNLGVGQRALLHKNLDRGLFNPFGKMDAKKGKDDGYTLSEDVYSPEFINSRNEINPHYTSYIFNYNGNRLIDKNGNNVTGEVRASDTFVRRPTKLAETLTTFDVEREGFGKTSTARGEHAYTPDEQRFMFYSNKPESDRAIKEKFGDARAKRGIVYHTQRIASTDTQIAKNIAMETKNYGKGESNEELFKGASECRSFTMEDPYSSIRTEVDDKGNTVIKHHLIRSKGNNNPYSVLKDSVVPNIYPKKKEDLRRLMFSIENLAYSVSDMPFLPENQRGPNNGRLMWFAPYGLKISESISVDWDETPFLGRIESVYTYSKMTRSAQLQFMLLIDAPPQAKQMTPAQLAKWFSGCLTEDVTPIDEKPKTTTPATPETVATTEVQIPGTIKSGPHYYFINDDHVIHHNSDLTPKDYEVTESKSGTVDVNNTFALNAKLKTETDVLLDLMMASMGKEFKAKITIEGHCSALHTEKYNVPLSYKRADAMMHYIVKAYGLKIGKTVGVKLKSQNKSLNSLTTADAKAKYKYEYETTDGALTFIYTGTGEMGAAKEGESSKILHTLGVKKDRNSKVTSVSFEKINTGVKTTQASTATAQTVIDNKAKASVKSKSEGDKILDSVNKVPFNRFNDGGMFTKGFDKMKHFKPVYHSQTPYDLQQRYTFLHQCTRPRRTLETAASAGANSLYGKMPVCILRLGDFWHSKMIIRNLNFDMTETTWDLNPEGMGMQPMIVNVTLDVTLIGGQALEFNVNKLLTANDQNFIANSTYYDQDGFYSEDRWDYQQSVKGGPDGKPKDPTSVIWGKMQELAKKK